MSHFLGYFFVCLPEVSKWLTVVHYIDTFFLLFLNQQMCLIFLGYFFVCLPEVSKWLTVVHYIDTFFLLFLNQQAAELFHHVARRSTSKTQEIARI